MFKKMNAHGFEDHLVFSLHTNCIPSNEDADAIKKAKEIAICFI